MEELLALLKTDFDDAEGWIRIVGADWFVDDLKLDVSVKLHDQHEAELWEIACAGVVDDCLRSEESSSLRVSSTSPLLKPYIEPLVPLMFAHNAVAPEALFGIVCSSCMEVMGRLDYLPRSINGSPTIAGIATSEYGLLGRFPQSLALRIVAALEDQPIVLNALPGHLPQRWNGSAHVAYGRLQALEVGASWVVADGFAACRASP